MVREVLLGLVEDQVDVTRGLRPVEHFDQPLGLDCAQIGDRGGQVLGRLSAPAREDDHDRRLGQLSQRPCDRGEQERGLADPARAVQDGESRGDEVRDDDLGVALAPEEVEGVELRVLERREPAIRGRDAHRSAARRRSSRAHVLVGLHGEHVDLEAAPESPLERCRLRVDRPGAIGDGTVAPDPVHDQPQVPVDHLVAQEEEVAAAESRGEGDGNSRCDVGAAEVVDVVVLRDHEALPLPLRERIDRAVQLEQDRAPLERRARWRTCSARRSDVAPRSAAGARTSLDWARPRRT